MQNHTTFDILAIEAEARRMRAQVMRNMIVAAATALRRLVARRPVGAVRNA